MTAAVTVVRAVTMDTLAIKLTKVNDVPNVTVLTMITNVATVKMATKVN